MEKIIQKLPLLPNLWENITYKRILLDRENIIWKTRRTKLMKQLSIICM